MNIGSPRMELLLIAIVLTLSDAQESQLRGPENTLSFVGSTVTLKCSSPSKNCNGTDWQKYVPGSSPMTIFKGTRTFWNVIDRDRYSVNNSSGCDLVIRNVQLADAGRFICSTIMSSSQVTKTAYLIIVDTQPKCTLNVSVYDTVEGDAVQLKCQVTYNGANNASIVWKGVGDAPTAVNNGNTISRSYSVMASAYDIPSFTCEASFALGTFDDYFGDPIAGMATNSIPNANCSTPDVKVIYSVQDVSLSPLFSYYPPGTVITCAARGHPSPIFKWQEMETDGLWMDAHNGCGGIITVTDVSSKRYRCVAMNVVRGSSYNATSHEIQVNNTELKDNLSSTGETASTYYIGIGCGIGILVTIILSIVANAILVRLGYLEFHPRPANKSLDDITQHPVHAMSPSSHQLSVMNRSIPRTGAPLAVEQESTYASLGDDRDANEYASLEQRQKVKPTKKSRP